MLFAFNVTLRLRSAPLAIRFVTNTTKENKRTLLERLRKLQFDISEEEIFTSLTAARNLVEQKGVRPMLLVHDSALPDFQGIRPLYMLWNQEISTNLKCM